MSFFFGGSSDMTYEEMQSRRRIADQLARANMRTPRNVGEGLAAIGNALAYRAIDRRTGERERELRDEFNQQFASLFGGGSAGGYTPAAPTRTEPDSEGGFFRNLFRGQPEENNQEGDPRRGMFPTGARVANDPAEFTTAFEYGMGEDLRPSQEWANVIGDSVEAVLGPGARVVVSSGHRPGDVGSQHSTGHAGDFAVYTADGRQLSWDSPEARAIAAEAASRGGLGFGAGPNYMGGNYFHFDLGLGGESAATRPGIQVWSDDDGAGHSSGGAGAAEWLQDLQTAAEGGTPVIDRSTVPTYTGGGGGGGVNADLAALIALGSNPMASPMHQAIIQSLIQRQLTPPQPVRGIEFGGNLVNPYTGEIIMEGEPDPQEWDIRTLADGRNYYVDPNGLLPPRLVAPDLEVPQPEPVRGIEFGGNLVNPYTGEIIMEGEPEPQEWDIRTLADGRSYYVDPNGTLPPRLVAPDLEVPQSGFRRTTEEEAALYGGPGQIGPDGRYYPLEDGPLVDMSGMSIGPDGEITPVEIGTIPPGYQAVWDAENNTYRFEPIPGGPAEADVEADIAAAEGREDAATTGGESLMNAADLALGAAQERWAGGALGGLAAFNPSSPNAEVYRQVQTIQAQSTFGALQSIRNNSPTGGAVGQASDRDLQLLASMAGALDPASPYFVRDLLAYTRQSLRVFHGSQEGERIFNERYGDQWAEVGNTGFGRGDGQPQASEPIPQAVTPEEPSPDSAELIARLPTMTGAEMLALVQNGELSAEAQAADPALAAAVRARLDELEAELNQ